MANPSSDRDVEFAALQARLAEVLAHDVTGSSVEHVVIALPSHSMPPTLLRHYASRLPGLEHRFLLETLRAGRVPGAHVVLVTSAAPSQATLDYYARLARPEDPDDVRRRVTCLVLPDDTPRGVSAKLLDRPDLVAELRARIGGRPAVIEAWNVTADEVDVALALDAPVNGAAPDLWGLGFKSRARRLFRVAGVPVPCGVEDVHDDAEVARAVDQLRSVRPDLDRVVVKVDNSGSGDGNLVVRTRDDGGRPIPLGRLRLDLLHDVPDWFVADLAAGGVVEELVAGPEVASPSAQVDIDPGGEVRLLATHEQVLGGAHGQEFTGSRFPADPAYADDLGRHVVSVAEVLAGAGAVGRVAVDFVAVRRAGRWTLAAVDLNLRKGGTSYSFAALRYLVPGRYVPASGAWLADLDGEPRCYRSSDAVVDQAWTGTPAARAIDAVRAAGLEFDPSTGTGVVLHMLDAMATGGRIGVTAIERTSADAERLYRRVPAALHAAAAAGHVGAPPSEPALSRERHEEGVKG